VALAAVRFNLRHFADRLATAGFAFDFDFDLDFCF
jgi:hypothetical protein